MGGNRTHRAGPTGAAIAFLPMRGVCVRACSRRAGAIGRRTGERARHGQFEGEEGGEQEDREGSCASETLSGQEHPTDPPRALPS